MSLRINSHSLGSINFFASSYFFRKASFTNELGNFNINDFFKTQLFVRRNCQLTSHEQTKSQLDLDIYRVPYSPDLFIGCGVHSLKDGRGSGSVVINVSEDPKYTKHAKRYVTKGKVHIAESTVKLTEEVNAKLNIHGRIGLFSSNTHYSMLKTCRSSSYVASYVIARHIEVGSQKLKFKHRNLSDLDLIKSHPDFYVKTRGDYFVSEIHYGGSYLATARVESESMELQQHLAGKVYAGLNNILVGGEVNEDFEHIRKFAKVDFSFYQKGGQGETSQPIFNMDIKKLQEKIAGFDTEIENKPSPISATVSPIKSATKDFPRNSGLYFDLSLQRKQISKLEEKILRVEDALKDLAYAKRFKEIFERFDVVELDELESELIIHKQDLETQILMCEESRGGCSYPKDGDLEKKLSTVQDAIKRSTSVSSNESEKLGDFWEETEGSYSGFWKRMGSSRVFEASWTGNIKGLVSIHIEGDRVIMHRYDDRNDLITASYTGALRKLKDGNRGASGAYIFYRPEVDLEENKTPKDTRPWSARIITKPKP